MRKRFEAQRDYYQSGLTRPVTTRRRHLKALSDAIDRFEDQILEALYTDLGKSDLEGYGTEISLVKEEIDLALKGVERWMEPEKKAVPAMHRPGRARVIKEPKGNVLILSPWNYPFQLMIAPLVGAIAAGNVAMLKPSEYAPATAGVMVELIEETFDETHVTVVTGGREVAEELLTFPFDHIFFTGSTPVGKSVMKAAAEHLASVTLELGGKSPTIVDATADLTSAARRIALGKFINAGQTCIAPDYVMVDERVEQEFLRALIQATDRYYGPKARAKGDYPKIINDKHLERLRKLIDPDQVIYGGQVDEETNQMLPTILTGVTFEDPVMEEEIFGPILPVISYSKKLALFDALRDMPNPLALYVFSEDDDFVEWITTSLPFGGGCINDTLTHVALADLPFGGAGSSGIGRYHGKASFDEMSRSKGLFEKTSRLDLPVKYPPYTRGKFRILKKVMK